MGVETDSVLRVHAPTIGMPSEIPARRHSGSAPSSRSASLYSREDILDDDTHVSLTVGGTASASAVMAESPSRTSNLSNILARSPQARHRILSFPVVRLSESPATYPSLLPSTPGSNANSTPGALEERRANYFSPDNTPREEDEFRLNSNGSSTIGADGNGSNGSAHGLSVSAPHTGFAGPNGSSTSAAMNARPSLGGLARWSSKSYGALSGLSSSHSPTSSPAQRMRSISIASSNRPDKLRRHTRLPTVLIIAESEVPRNARGRQESVYRTYLVVRCEGKAVLICVHGASIRCGVCLHYIDRAGLGEAVSPQALRDRMRGRNEGFITRTISNTYPRCFLM